MTAICQVDVLGFWRCQDFVTIAGEDDRTGWLDAVEGQIQGYAQKSGCCPSLSERCLYVPSVARNGDTSDHWQWYEVSGRHLRRRASLSSTKHGVLWPVSGALRGFGRHGNAMVTRVGKSS